MKGHNMFIFCEPSFELSLRDSSNEEAQYVFVEK